MAKDAKLIGMRLTENPTDWLEVGASYTFMWSSESRPESFSLFCNALKGTKGNGGRDGGDPTNPLGSFDA